MREWRRSVDAKLKKAPAKEGTKKADSVGEFILGRSKKLTLSGALRLRGEVKDNTTDFEKGKADNNDFALSRIRLRFDFEVTEKIEAVFELQDSRQFGSESSPANTGNEVQSTDASLAYMELRDLGVPHLTLRMGRQILNFGDQRLVGAFDYNNFANRFDAVSAIYRVPGAGKKKGDRLRVHAFASTINETNTKRDDVRFFGAVATSENLVPGLTLEASYFFLSDNNKRGVTGENGLPGSRHIHTLGGRIKVDKGIAGGTLEGYTQFGNYADDNVDAHAIHASVWGQLKKVAMKPRLEFIYNEASGDKNGKDGDHGTFENLFPTNHLYYGVVDLFSWQNISHQSVRLKVFPAEGLSVWADAHLFALDTTKDFHTNAGRKAVRADLAPRNSGRLGASKSVGKELDLSAKYKVNKHLSLFAQYGHFFPGRYYTAVGASHNAYFGQLTVLVKF